MMEKRIKGIINITSLGTGYLRTEEGEDDIKIEASLLNTALNNDEVEVFLFSQKKGEKKQGEVVKILKRAKKKFVGTIEKTKGKNFAFLVPDDPKMYVDIFLPNNNVKNKTKALVEIVSWKNSKKNPEGKILKIIGKKGENETELHSIVLEKGLAIDFPKKVEEDAKRVKKKVLDIKKRKDFRQTATFTIDPEDAKDFDDALSVKKIEGDLYEIGIHIADVSYYVEEESKLDKEAKNRAFSIYLVDRTIPMLPEVLSNDVCSLKPNEDRATFSVVLKMKKDGSVVDAWFGETVIHSKRRFTYKEAQNILDNESGDFYEELSVLADIAKKLKEERVKRGALLIEDDELFFNLDHDGRPLSVYRKEHLFTHNLIEEFMVLANKRVSNKFNTLYRVHETPDKGLINDLLSFLSGLGHNINIEGNEISSFELNSLFKKIEGKDEEFLVKKTVLRSMAKAIYSTKNKKHFGLAIDEYMHFTSPIRRYADLLMHRIVKKKLKGEKVNSRDYDKIAKEISLKELDVLDAERSSVAYKQVEYMLKKIGEELDVIISGVTSSGIFVQELETKAEGMISVRDMNDDYYILDEENYALIGTRKRKRYALGNKIKAKLAGGSIETRRLDFIFPK
jgi:ribonuclease R